jgi:hypothetical protein
MESSKLINYQLPCVELAKVLWYLNLVLWMEPGRGGEDVQSLWNFNFTFIDELQLIAFTELKETH